MKMDVKQQVVDFIGDRSVVILGFGKEGRSTHAFLRSVFPDLLLGVADSNTTLCNDVQLATDINIEFVLGANYLDEIKRYDLVFKTPGISFKDYEIPEHQEVSSQTDLFFRLFAKQSIGVTGTKGKSTTVSLLKHVLDSFYSDVLLIGNIGVPALDVAGQIGEDTLIVFELSSHQLEFTNHSPHIAILLNLYQEHLDHYRDYKSYRFAKWNIAKYQGESDYFIRCLDNNQIIKDEKNQIVRSFKLNYSFNNLATLRFDRQSGEFVLDSERFSFNRADFLLLGEHNLYNLMAVLLVAKIQKLPLEKVLDVAINFKGLPHRMEFVDEVQGVRFYNDSIATIPEASIRALESIEDVQTLILGGFDREINYGILIDYLQSVSPLKIILLGKVGKLLFKRLQTVGYEGNLYSLKSFDDVVDTALSITDKTKACLLSPAASSYDAFKNFEERGQRFKDLIFKAKEKS